MIIGFLITARPVRKVIFTECSQNPDGIMSPHGIHQTVDDLRRVVFQDIFNPVLHQRRIAAHDIVDDGGPERVVHDRIQLIAFKIVFTLIVRDLAGGILPDLS